MKLSSPGWMSQAARKLRAAGVRQRPIAGQFQRYSHTLPDRYPWLFGFAAAHLADNVGVRLLSFGCSTGEEVLSLRRYFPQASIRGIDVDPHNIATCRALARAWGRALGDVGFEVAATTERQDGDSLDAIFCLAVLCLGDLVNSQARRCDPRLLFRDFEHVVTDFARCLKPSGLLVLHTTNFRFCDTQISARFDTLLDAREEQMAPDAQYGRDNQRLTGPRYRSVVFRKRP